MRLAVVRHEGRDVPIARTGREQGVPLDALGTDLPSTVEDLLPALVDPAVRARLEQAVAEASAQLAVPAVRAFRRPLKPRSVVGIGLNYRPHAEDLGAPLPEEPSYFTKDPRTVVSTGETILLPPESHRVTAEGELALVMGSRCFRAGPEEALGAVAGACVVLDQTAEDILQRNTRFLTRSKNFPSFLVLGEDLVTLDELTADRAMPELEVVTSHNGEPHSSGAIAQMLFDPGFVVSFLSHVLPLEAGDVISTGTPGAVVLADGDVVEARVSGIGSVHASVRRPPAADYAREVLAQLERQEAATR